LYKQQTYIFKALSLYQL